MAWAISVLKNLAIPTSVGTMVATASTGSLAAEGVFVGNFTPTVSGNYQIWTSFSGDAYGYICSGAPGLNTSTGAPNSYIVSNDDGCNYAMGASRYSNNQPFLNATLTANTAYQVYIRGYSTSTVLGSGNIYVGLSIWHRDITNYSTINLSAALNTPYTLISNASVSNGLYHCYPFTVPTTGTYSIYAEPVSGTTTYGDTYGRIGTENSWFNTAGSNGGNTSLLSGQIAANDDSNNNGQYLISTTLTAGTTYYLYHSGYSCSSTSSQVNIMVKLTAEGGGFVLGTSINLGALNPTSNGTNNSSNTAGKVTRFYGTLAARSSMEVVVSMEASAQNMTAYYYVGTPGTWNEGTGACASATLVATNSSHKSIFINNTSTSAVTVNIYLHHQSLTSAWGTTYIYYAIHNYNEYYTLGTENITISSATAPGQTIQINQTAQKICFRYEVRKVAVSVPAMSKSTFYIEDKNITNQSSYVTNYGYLNSLNNVGIIISSGAPTEYILYNYNGHGNSQWQLTFLNLGTTAKTVYLYDRPNTTNNAHRGSTLFYYSEQVTGILASGTLTYSGTSVIHPAWMIGKGSVKNTTINPATVTKITFQTAAYTGSYSTSWDGSENADGSITVYANGTEIIVSGNGATNIIAGNALTVCTNMSACTSIIGCNVLNTQGTTSFTNCFKGARSLVSFPNGVSGWDANQSIDFSNMFQGCTSLTSVTPSSWRAPHTMNLSNFVEGCSNLQYLYLSNLDTRQATNMTSMMANCPKLFYIIVGTNFKQKGSTGSVTGAEFPNQSSTTIATQFKDSIVDGRWRNLSTGAVYNRNAIPQQAATYIPWLSDGRPTLATRAEQYSNTTTSYTINGTSVQFPYWLYRGIGVNSVTAATLNNITSISIIDSYTPTGTETASWDASLHRDNKVRAYLRDTEIIIAGNGSGYIDFASYATNCFGYRPNLTRVFAPALTFGPNNKTTSASFIFIQDLNLEEIDISGVNFSNGPNTIMQWAVTSRTSSSGNYTTVLLDKLSKIKVGDHFSHQRFGVLPTPNASTVVPSGMIRDGHWYDERMHSYDPGHYNDPASTLQHSNLPDNVAHTYTAYYDPNYVPPPPTHRWKVYNGTEWVELKPQVYDGTTWQNLITTLYDQNNWI